MCERWRKAEGGKEMERQGADFLFVGEENGQGKRWRAGAPSSTSFGPVHLRLSRTFWLYMELTETALTNGSIQHQAQDCEPSQPGLLGRRLLRHPLSLEIFIALFDGNHGP